MEEALLPPVEDFPDAEERRLMYVALTLSLDVLRERLETLADELLVDLKLRTEQ